MRDPTEGVSFSQMRMPFLKRNLPAKLEQDEEYNRYYRRLVHHDGLIIRICANSYHILYEPGSYDWWWRPTAATQEESEENVKELATVKERRHDRFREKFINNPGWAHGLSKDEVDASNQKFRAWVKDPNAPGDVDIELVVLLLVLATPNPRPNLRLTSRRQPPMGRRATKTPICSMLPNREPPRPRKSNFLFSRVLLNSNEI